MHSKIKDPPHTDLKVHWISLHLGSQRISSNLNFIIHPDQIVADCINCIINYFTVHYYSQYVALTEF